ncbi:lytic polysaccharide monooxygenase [Spongiactinospora sp. 9N601]
MRRTITLLAAAIMAIGSTVFIAQPAMAHGYISNPPSRQAMCAQGRVSNCGPIIYEPQSVEGPKGLRSCSGGVGRFSQLDDESRAWPATSVGNNVSLTWKITAQHRTSTWEYFIGGTRIASFNDNGRQAPATFSHNVNLGGRTGRIKLLAVWNVYDTGNAFYACVDLQVGPGGPQPTPDPTPTPTDEPTTPGGTWAVGTNYQPGSTVTYGGSTYRCVQGHTALTGWEPPNAPSLWQQV